ncbi:MAG: tetratricopeptide repeat protein [Bacteroides sp.]|nr:tetratricopeptide repeat protein [Bacteroides sp.]
MMKCHKILVGALLAAAALTAWTTNARELNSPEAPGYISRGRTMLADLNCLGTLQQTNEALRLPRDGQTTEEATYLRALASLHRGEAQANKLLQEWIDTYPESPKRYNAVLALGDYYFARKDYAEARRVYYGFQSNILDRSLEEDREYRLGYCNLLLGLDKEARTWFNMLVNTGSDTYSTAARFYLGYLDYKEGDYNTAAPMLEQVARSGDKELTPVARMYLAQIFFKQGNNERALDEGRKVLASGMTDFYPEANRICGEALYNMGRTSEAIPMLWLYADAVENPAPSALYILGTDEYSKGEYLNAISLLKRVVSGEGSQQPENGAMKQSAWLFLGQAYAATDKTDNALMAFDSARRSDYDQAITETAFYNYAVATIDGGRVPFGSSVRTLEEFLSKYPNSTYAPQVEEYIISGYLADNNYAGALASIDRIKNPSDRIRAARQNVIFALGTREYADGQFAQALPRFKQAASQTRAPYSRSIAQQAELWSGMTLYELGRYKEAATAFQTYLRNASGNDNRALAQYNLGYAEYQQENFPAAYSAFARSAAETKAGTDTDRLADTYCRMGDCLYYQSNFEGAAADYARAYELNPSSGDYALYQNAVMRGLQRDNKGKIEALDIFMERFPTSALVADALLEKAETQVAMGNNSGALLTYRTLTDSYSSTATGRKGYLQMAITLMSEGRTNEGERAYKEIITTYPTSEEARMATDDLKRYYAEHGGLDSFADWISRISNAPQLNTSEMDRLTFEAAEKEYVSKDSTAKLASYLERYPQGAYRAKALYYLAEAASLADEQEKAHKYASELLAHHPDAETVEDVLLIKADAEVSGGRTEAAFATFGQLETRAVSATHLYEARLGQLRTASELGYAEAAISAADKLLASTAAGAEATPEIRSLRAEALDKAGRSIEAEEEWSRLTGNGQTDVYSAKAAVLMSNSLLKRGETERAHKMIDDFINSNPSQQYWLARGFIVLSDILRAEGDDFEADQYLQSLRTNYPGNEADITRMIDERLK